MGQWLTTLAYEFSQQTGIIAEHISIGWLYFDKGHYLDNTNITDYQTKNSHPLIVELLAPDFNTPENIQAMINVLARIISNTCDININNIFIYAHTATSGQVFDDGHIINW